MSSGAESCGMADPMLFVLANLKGSRVEILLNSGERYTGIFHAFSPDSMGIALRMARKADAPQTELPLDTFVVQFSDFSQIVAHDVAASATSTTCTAAAWLSSRLHTCRLPSRACASVPASTSTAGAGSNGTPYECDRGRRRVHSRDENLRLVCQLHGQSGGFKPAAT